MIREGKVAIPYSSGLSFLLGQDDRVVCWVKEESQSLIHQVLVSYPARIFLKTSTTSKSQSLIHQVLVSYKRSNGTPNFKDAESQSLIHQVLVSYKKLSHHVKGLVLVAIPYSSGLSFLREKTKPSCKRLSLSQSLIHQVLVSYLGLEHRSNTLSGSQSLIHQVLVSYNHGRFPVSLNHPGRNPLFIRS